MNVQHWDEIIQNIKVVNVTTITFVFRIAKGANTVVAMEIQRNTRHSQNVRLPIPRRGWLIHRDRESYGKPNSRTLRWHEPRHEKSSLL